MEKKRILTITPQFLPQIGGIETHVFNLNVNLVKLGKNIFIVAPKKISINKFQPDEDIKQILRINSFYLPGWPYPTLRSVSIPLDFGLKIKSLIRNGDFDIVHVHGHHYPFSWIAITSAHKYGIPNVLTLHGRYALNPKVLGGKSKVEDIFNKYLFTKILSKTNAVIGLTEHITDYAKKFGREQTKYFTIPNGVNTNVFKKNLERKKEYREKYHISPDKTVILFRGRFEHVKGIIEFVQAIKYLPIKNKIEVVIVGGGSHEYKIKSLIEGVNGIHLFPWQPSEKIHELYIASDIFVIPSRFEALPITVIEAMNAGLHIVYSPVGGIPDILERYFPKTELSEVSKEEILKVLSGIILNFNDSKRKDSLLYAQKFDWANIALETTKVYEECKSLT